MRIVALTAALLVATAALPAHAQSTGHRGVFVWPTANQPTSTTPSRMERSNREMNRGRTTAWRRNFTPVQARNYAEDTLRRAGFQCTVAEAVMLHQLRDGTPILEVDCAGT